MRIYKFKDLAHEWMHPHFLQIVLEKSIWCASPNSLNDEDEFRFELDYEPSLRTQQLLSQVLAQHGTSPSQPHLSAARELETDRLRVTAPRIIAEMIEKCRREIGITSFSMTKADDHLWKEYGGKGNGACIEINIPDHLVGHAYHQVKYVPYKIFHVDIFLESALLPDRLFQNVLLTKTKKKWEQEEEIRFIGNRQNVSLIFDGYISEVTFGSEVPAETLERLTIRIANHCRTNNIKISRLS